MSLRVLRMAAGSALQDEGRPGWRRYGVPPGGAFDGESHQLALALVGRSEGVTLELPMLGGTFEAIEDDRLAVVGAPSPIDLDHHSVPEQSSFRVSRGQHLSIGPARGGVRVYLASARGWSGGTVLGSFSTVTPDFQTLDAAFCQGKDPVRLEHPPGSLEERPIRIVFGPQVREMDRLALETGAFRVSLNSNRMGIRLEGGAFETAEEFPSEPSVAGAIQLTPSGELLIHGPDGPTLAGYPKIAVVIDADLDRLAQLRSMEPVRFEWVELTEARRLSMERRRRIGRLAASIRMASSV